MSGAMKNFDHTQKVVDNYLEKNDIYTSIKNPKFDFRGYAAFIKKNNLKATDITPSMLKQFSS